MSKGIQGQSMKRSLSLSLVLILITFGLPTNSYAATDGCPDTWSIDYAAEIAARKAVTRVIYRKQTKDMNQKHKKTKIFKTIILI